VNRVTRVLLIHQAFASHSDAGGTRHYELAKRAGTQGVHFTVVTSDVSYLTGQRRRRLGSDNDTNAVRVIRSYAHSSLHRSFVWRVLSFLSFMVSSTWAGLRAGDVDVVMGTSPPIFQALSAWLIAEIRRRPFLLEIRDLWPEFAIGLGVLTNPWLIRCSRWLERFLYRRADRLLVNSPAYRDYLQSQGVPLSHIEVIPNGTEPEMFTPEARGLELRREIGLDRKFIVTYAGALGMANDIDTVLRAARRLLQEERIHFLLVGDGKEAARLKLTAEQMGLRNVTFAGARAKSQMPEVLAASDLCLATLRNISMFKTTYPNKVFDYMAAGRATVLAIDGVIREVVEEAGAGVFVEPGNDTALAEAVRRLSGDPGTLSDMGRNARRYVVEHFDRNRQASGFVALIHEVCNCRTSAGLYRRAGKRVFDFAFASAALVLVSPLLVSLAIAVRLRLGSPVFFRQQRPGFKGRAFTILKFRTMTDARSTDGELLPDCDRLTRFGRWMRALSIDELPELLNVVRGDMTLVGPRPLLMEYLDRYDQEQARRNEVRPGITGWAQVNGRNAITWEERFELDVFYVDRLSFALDLRIIYLTLLRVMARKGIAAEGHATMPIFQGSSAKTAK